MESNDFFPCNARVAFSVTDYGLSMGVVAVNHSLVQNISALVHSVSDLVFEHTGYAYAHAFDFPSAYGPDYYLAAIGAVPQGCQPSENKGYIDRITQWRDNTWHKKLRPSDGYLREVYPVNFVSKAHLEKTFNNQKFSAYMEKTGSLSTVSDRDGLYRWDIDESNIHSVRQELEQSGLVLSAAN